MTACVWRAEEVTLNKVHAAGLPFQKERSFDGELNAAEARSDIQRCLSPSLSVSMYFCFEFTFCEVCQFSLEKSSAAALLYV